jgi:hypothetical protein
LEVTTFLAKKGKILPFSILAFHRWTALAHKPATNLRGPRNLPEQTQRSLPGFRREVLDHRSFLSNQVCSDFCVQITSGIRRPNSHRSPIFIILNAGHIAFALQGIDHSTRRALVQEHFFRQDLKAQRAPFDQCFDGITLGYRHVVTADPISITELMDANQLVQRLVQVLRILSQLIVFTLRHNRHNLVVSCNNNPGISESSTPISG